MPPKIQEYYKGILGAVGAVSVTVLSLGDQFCGSWWPAITSVITAVLVVAVPNKPRS